MQFFPVTADIVNTAVDAANYAASAGNQHGGSSFETVYSSFIEEGRTDYSGRPSGFSAVEEENGTMSREKTELLKSALRKRNVQDASMETLEQLMASGAPMTIGRIFGVLSGNSRVSPALEGEERSNFTQLMGKLGFTKEEADELLVMTDEGKTSAAWKRISNKIGAMGKDSVDLHSSEFSAMLKGLDISDAAKTQMKKLFGDADELKLNQEQLNALFSDVSREIAAKDLAAKTVQTRMRDAMTEALQAAKVKELSDPVADTRGNRRSEQSELLMQNSVLKKTGEHALTGSRPGRDADPRDEASLSDRKDGKSRAERILATASDAKIEPKTKTTPQDPVSRLMQRIDTANVDHRSSQTATSNSAQDLNSVARNFRQEIFSQVENGLLQNTQNGNRQITLQLNPNDLGQMTLILSVRQGEVRALIRAEQGESAAVLTEQMAELKASLEAQGLKVKELEVQTQLQDNSFAGQWDGAHEHNLMHDAKERARMVRLSQLRRDAAGGTETGSLLQQAQHSDESGLHIVA